MHGANALFPRESARVTAFYTHRKHPKTNVPPPPYSVKTHGSHADTTRFTLSCISGAFSANLQTKIALAAIALDAPTARATVGLDTAIHASLTGDTVELKNGR
jgi:hypothetical protein